MLQGAVNKRIAPAYMPVTAFAYVLFYLKQHQPSGAKLLDHPDWKSVLPESGARRTVPLRGQSTGPTRISCGRHRHEADFPGTSLEEYANVLAQKSH